MKLSIITVNLNNRDGLLRTIDSVVSQTFRDFEWIVIDGGSTDGSKALIEQYADHFAYWVSEPDKGIYNAMNKGIKVAMGDYLLFLNSGDYLFSSSVLKEAFHALPEADIVYGDLNICDSTNGSYIQTYPETFSFSILYYNHIPHPSTLIRAQLLKDDPYDEALRIVSDWKFFLQKSLDGYVFCHIPVVITCFEPNGLSNDKDACKMERRMVIDEIVPKCIQNDMQRLSELTQTQPDGQVRKLQDYRKQNRLYRKLTTALLSLINLIEKLRTWKKKD